MTNHGGFRRKLPEETLRAIYEWDDKRTKIGPVKRAIADWRKSRRKIGTGKKLAESLGISSTTLYQIISARRQA